MPDGPFKSMTPDPSTTKGDYSFMEQPRFRCDNCKGWVYAGDWPWCKGIREGHKR